MEKRNETMGARAGMNRRDFLKISGAGIAGASLLGVAGCGGGGEAEQNEAGATVVTFSVSPDDSGTRAQIVERFNKENEGEISINFREAPTDSGEFFQQLQTQFQAGGGDIDVIGGDVIWPAQFAANGWITALSERFTEDMRSEFLQGPVDANTYEGEIYGVPWFTDAGMLYYRRDLLEQSGFSEPPKSWEELIEMAKKTQQDSGTDIGFIFQGADYEGGVVNGLEYVNSFGGAAISGEDSNQVTIDSPESIEGLKMERRMIEEGITPLSVSNYTEQESQAAFLNGNAIFCRNWPYVYALVGDPDASKINEDQVGVAPLPAGDGGESVSGLGGWNFYLNANTDQETQDAAWKFIQYMTASEQQKEYALGGSYLPTRTALYDDQEILDAVPVIALGGEALKRTVPRPVSPYYSDMSQEMADQFNASLKGDITPEKAASNLQTSLQEIVDQGQQV